MCLVGYLHYRLAVLFVKNKCPLTSCKSMPVNVGKGVQAVKCLFCEIEKICTSYLALETVFHNFNCLPFLNCSSVDDDSNNTAELSFMDNDVNNTAEFSVMDNGNYLFKKKNSQ